MKWHSWAQRSKTRQSWPPRRALTSGPCTRRSIQIQRLNHPWDQAWRLVLRQERIYACWCTRSRRPSLAAVGAARLLMALREQSHHRLYPSQHPILWNSSQVKYITHQKQHSTTHPPPHSTKTPNLTTSLQSTIKLNERESTSGKRWIHKKVDVNPKPQTSPTNAGPQKYLKEIDNGKGLRCLCLDSTIHHVHAVRGRQTGGHFVCNLGERPLEAILCIQVSSR